LTQSHSLSVTFSAPEAFKGDCIHLNCVLRDSSNGYVKQELLRCEAEYIIYVYTVLYPHLQISMLPLVLEQYRTSLLAQAQYRTTFAAVRHCGWEGGSLYSYRVMPDSVVGASGYRSHLRRFEPVLFGRVDGFAFIVSTFFSTSFSVFIPCPTLYFIDSLTPLRPSCDL